MFTPEELLLIFNDQKEMLEAVHHRAGGGYGQCSDMMTCPINHFDEDFEDIFLRQGIMKKIAEISSKIAKEKGE